MKPNPPIDSSDYEHVATDKCGFDRNESHSENRYVCLCGWSDPCEWPLCDCTPSNCCLGMEHLT